MPVINIADVQIPVQTVQQTVPSLKIMDSTGTIYYADTMPGACPDAVKVSDGNIVYSIGAQTLYYETSNFNSCETINLEPGCYYVEVRGGTGGDGGNNSGSGADAITKTYSFTILENTSAIVFRGADGAPGTVNIDGDITSGGGGGASGVPSLFAIGDVVIVSDGGNGGRGGFAHKYGGDEQQCGAGGGGNAGDMANGANALVNYVLTDNLFMCGAGGGGAPGGVGGTDAVNGAYRGDAGNAGTQDSGGAGGGAHRVFDSKDGGAGGATVSFSCAGQTLYSYGGGGGGAVEARSFSQVNLEGGNGGSGSINSSDTSMVRIYKFGRA